MGQRLSGLAGAPELSPPRLSQGRYIPPVRILFAADIINSIVAIDAARQATQPQFNNWSDSDCPRNLNLETIEWSQGPVVERLYKTMLHPSRRPFYPFTMCHHSRRYYRSSTMGGFHRTSMRGYHHGYHVRRLGQMIVH